MTKIIIYNNKHSDTKISLDMIHIQVGHKISTLRLHALLEILNNDDIKYHLPKCGNNSNNYYDVSLGQYSNIMSMYNIYKDI